MDLVARAARQPRSGETLAGQSFATLPGGKGANQALAAARLGADTVMFGKVGADAFGVQLREYLDSNGVDVSHVLTTPAAPTGVALIVVTDAGENSIVVVPGANALLSPADVAACPIARGDVVLCQFETPLETSEALMSRCRAAGARTILNPAPATPSSRKLLALADVLIVNETELGFFLEDDALDISTTATVANAASRLRTHRDQVVVTTLGARGAVAVDNDNVIVVDGERVNVVDTTAAGDTFAGATAARLAAGDRVEAALSYANAAAALSVQKHGAGPSIPTAEEVERVV